MTLFTLRLKMDDRYENIKYDCICKCITDKTLEEWFNHNLVSECIIIQNDLPISKLPKPLISWKRFKDQILSDSEKILRGAKL